MSWSRIGLLLRSAQREAGDHSEPPTSCAKMDAHEHSLCYGVYHAGCQVAFARLVTDYSTFAYLCDVVVDEHYRGRGLSKWIMSCIMENPSLSELRRFVLATRDAHGLYEKFGFKQLSSEEQRRFMSVLKDDV